MTNSSSTESSARISRRALLGAFGAGAVTVAGVGVAGAAVARSRSGDAEPLALQYDFHGEHQSGITTPMQDHLHFAALNMTSASREDLIALLQAWSAAAADMMAGKSIGVYGATSGPYDAPPHDTGEALDLSASGLTITFGFGPSLFRDASGADRFGIAHLQPAGLHEA